MGHGPLRAAAPLSQAGALGDIYACTGLVLYGTQEMKPKAISMMYSSDQDLHRPGWVERSGEGGGRCLLCKRDN